jgi:hypothetical protein
MLKLGQIRIISNGYKCLLYVCCNWQSSLTKTLLNYELLMQIKSRNDTFVWITVKVFNSYYNLLWGLMVGEFSENFQAPNNWSTTNDVIKSTPVTGVFNVNCWVRFQCFVYHLDFIRIRCQYNIIPLQLAYRIIKYNSPFLVLQILRAILLVIKQL